MEIFSENSKYVNSIKKLTYEADKIIQQHQQLVELDIGLNINRESLSALRREYYGKVKNDKRPQTLENINYNELDISNKSLKLGDFFLYTSNYIIYNYLLSEKKAIQDLIEDIRIKRYYKVKEFVKKYPNIPEHSISEINFIIKDAIKEKPKDLVIQDKSRVDTQEFVSFVPCFKIFSTNSEKSNNQQVSTSIKKNRELKAENHVDFSSID
ncbi:alpha beta hydrolase [Cryptosporidium felis]|nr:alpha beta hydrolase [Cryptosporidium felis]